MQCETAFTHPSYCKRRFWLLWTQVILTMSHSVSSALSMRQHCGRCFFSGELRSTCMVRLQICSNSQRQSATPAFASQHRSDPIRPWLWCRSATASSRTQVRYVNPDRGPASVCFRHNTTNCAAPRCPYMEKSSCPIAARLEAVEPLRRGRRKRLEGSRERSRLFVSRNLHLKSESDNGLDSAADPGIDPIAALQTVLVH
ncbi:hypothetical protein V8C42DRAFT_322406, partial [Trichoderma barbatum]